MISNEYEFLGFIDDTIDKQGNHPYGFKVYERTILHKYPNAKLLAVPGSPTSYEMRDEIIRNFNSDISRFVTIIHPLASISPLAKIGYNCIIMAGVVITANSIIGNHVCILPNTVVHHDSNIDDYTLIGSGVTIAGNTVVGKQCYIGSGSSIINGISIGDKALAGIGTNIIRSVPSGSKVVGNPAKEI